jgi:hypothetical protein
MRRVFIQTLITLCLLTFAAFAQQDEPAVLKPAWNNDTTFEFGIYKSGQRTASAYYRILREETMSRPAWRFKYVGRDGSVSEATECWVDADTLRPMRSTRKVVYDGRTFYQDAAYGEGNVTLRQRHEGEKIRESVIPARSALYDYEQLIWLVPQLDLADGARGRFELFSMLSSQTGTVLITCDGPEDITVAGKQFPARRYTFEVGLTPYRYWAVMQDGIAVPARVEMGGTTFENLKLNSKKVTPFPRYGGSAPAAEEDARPDAAPEEPGNRFLPPPGE